MRCFVCTGGPAGESSAGNNSGFAVVGSRHGGDGAVTERPSPAKPA